MDQEVLFGQRAYTDPWGTLRELQQADMRRPSAGRKARMAALHAVVGDLVESVMLAGAVVEASEPVAPLERARAHVSLAASWAAAGGLNVAVRGMTPRQHIAAGLRILAEADPGGGYLTAASLINAATAEYTIGDLDAAYRHLGRARGLVSSWGKSAPMRGPYLGLIEFNTVVMADLDERGMVAALLGVHDQARREGVLRTCGLVDQHLAGRFAAAHLYTPALIHGERAREIWQRCRRPERVASIDYTLLEIYKNLGAEEERGRLERQLIGITRPESVFRGIATQAKAKVSEHYHDLADYRRSEQYEESAWKTIEPVLKAEGGHVSSGGALGLVFGGVRTARKLGDDELVAKWRARAAFMARGIDAYLESSTGWGASFGRYLEAIIDGDRQAVAALQQEIVRKTLEVNAYGKAALPAVIGLQEHLDTVEPGEDLDTDLREYWQHLGSLASEDAEEIRSRFRSANVVPVLNRILGSNPDLDPWIQFETVELARTGSVTGPQAVGLPDTDQRGHIRRIALADYKNRGIIFPAAIGEACGIALHPVAASRFGETDRDLGRLLRSGSFSQDPDVLQLYLRGDVLHWAYVRTGRASVAAGSFTDSDAVRAVAAVYDWASPRVTRADIQTAALLGLPEASLPMVAAIRCAVGPFVDQPALAEDFAMVLPRRARGAVLDHFRAVTPPAVEDICRWIGRLLPDLPEVWDGTAALALSLQGNLAQIPFALARHPREGRHLGTTRPVVSLAPMNTLAHMPEPAAVPAGGPVPWQLTVVGNCMGDLGYSGATSSAADIRNALLLPPEDAWSSAVLYKGHFLRSKSGRPSLAGLPSGAPGQVFRAADILLESGKVAGPARLAIMACEASGWGLAEEWGGTASALMLRGVREVIAPHWPLIDSPASQVLDGRVAGILTCPGDLAAAYADMIGGLLSDWLDGRGTALGPHWWAGLALIKA
ncbi:hypothetical protein [Actinacidiphila glaucinigra]|uniref:hypothetical protein n=1 Tax=Actinacidiphila glaucinigra TaxID=235986 RepID=UPI002E368931|nr:hypothetical protein [Actinacidiphila glaucinigra]